MGEGGMRRWMRLCRMRSSASGLVRGDCCCLWLSRREWCEVDGCRLRSLMKRSLSRTVRGSEKSRCGLAPRCRACLQMSCSLIATGLTGRATQVEEQLVTFVEQCRDGRSRRRSGIRSRVIALPLLTGLMAVWTHLYGGSCSTALEEV